MRRPRIKVEGEGFYHVVSRIGGRRFLMDDEEKGILLGLVRASAAFSGVEVYTYALMDNHFHLLIRVPPRIRVEGVELERRVRALYGPERSAKVFRQWGQWEKTGAKERVEADQDRLRARMYDLSQFCKTFKEAYTQSYNRRHGNTGTIWEGRFKSILLEGACRALMAVGAYIHLNPVRAGMVDDPVLARFTGYGAACAGDEAAREGLQALVARILGGNPPQGGWKAVQEIYRDAMEGIFAKDAESPKAPSSTVPASGVEPGNRRTATEEKRMEFCSVGELLRRRCLGFLHGGALGSAGFLREQAHRLPHRLHRRTEGQLDRCGGLGLVVWLGVREAS